MHEWSVRGCWTYSDRDGTRGGSFARGAVLEMRALLVAFCSMATLTACSIPAVTFVPADEPPLDGGPPIDSVNATVEITVRRDGTASGIVSIQGLELSCAESCTATVAVGTMVTLAATPAVDAMFG